MFSPQVGDEAMTPLQSGRDMLAASGWCVSGAIRSVGRLLAETSPAPSSKGRLLTIQWEVRDSVALDDMVRVKSVITRVYGKCVERYVQLLDGDDLIREVGSEIWMVPGDVDANPAVDFCSPAWGELMRTRLDADTAFARSLATWDGTIGLRCGEREIHIRVYRGKVIDVSRRSPRGATFTFVAPSHTWVELTFGVHDDFMRRAIKGEFCSTGDGYEYLRLTKPLGMIMGHARDIVREVYR